MPAAPASSRRFTSPRSSSWEADERGEAERPRVADEPQRVGLRELRVLEVDDREIERGGGDLDHLGGGELDERPAGPAPGPQALGEA